MTQNKCDLISREALKTELNSRPFPQDYSTTLLLGAFNELIDNAPTIIGVDLSELPDYTGTPDNSYVNKEEESK